MERLGEFSTLIDPHLKTIYFSDDYSSAVKSLKAERNVTVFVVDAGDDESQQQNSELTEEDKTIVISQWRGADSEVLGPIADYICKVCIILVVVRLLLQKIVF